MTIDDLERTYHECDECHGTGVIDPDTVDEKDCPECDGMGEWFE